MYSQVELSGWNDRITTYIKHAGTVDFNLLIWSAGTFYIQALAVIISGQSGLTDQEFTSRHDKLFPSKMLRQRDK